MAFNLDDYEPVAARHARWLADHPTGRTVTHLLSAPGADVCVIRAELWVDDQLMATGLAEEIRGQGNVNRTSHVENCETSAVGRALANAGYAGSDVNKRPSREEMAKVQRMSTRTDEARPSVRIVEPAGAASEKQVNYAKSLLKAQNYPLPADIASLSKGDISSLIERLKNGTYTPPVNDEEPF